MFFIQSWLTVQVVAERGLQAHPSWVNKCIQLYETYLVRHGIMLVGPAGSGAHQTAIYDLPIPLFAFKQSHVILCTLSMPSPQASRSPVHGQSARYFSTQLEVNDLRTTLYG